MIAERRKYREWPTQDAIKSRIDLAADTFEIPPEVVDKVKRQGMNPNYTRSTGVLVKFAGTYGLSLDWLICGDIRPMIRCTAIVFKQERDAV